MWRSKEKGYKLCCMSLDYGFCCTAQQQPKHGSRNSSRVTICKFVEDTLDFTKEKYPNPPINITYSFPLKDTLQLEVIFQQKASCDPFAHVRIQVVGRSCPGEWVWGP